MSTTNDEHFMYCPKCGTFNEQNRGMIYPYVCTKCGTIWKIVYDIKQVIIHEGKKN